MRNSELLSRTLYLVRKREPTLTYSKIADDTGLTRKWIELLMQNKHTCPDVHKVEALYNYLSPKPLKFEE